VVNLSPSPAGRGPSASAAFLPHVRTGVLGWLTERFELTRGDRGHNLRTMEGLRGAAVILVFLVHYVSVWEPWLAPGSVTSVLADQLHTMGQAGVDLFFVLSGYLIYGSLIERAQPLGRFLLRRIQRIYPTFLLMFTLYLALSLVLHEVSRLPDMAHGRVLFLIENVLLLPGLFLHETPLLSVAWTLSYEMFYYLMIPLIIGALGLRRRSAGFRILVFAALALLLILDGWIFKGPLRLIMFVAGVLLFELLKTPLVLPRPSSWVGAVFGVCALLGLILPFSGAGAYVAKIVGLFAGFFMLCLVCFRDPKGWLGSRFSTLPIRWLGNMSYSYYLMHSLALRAIFLVLPHVLPLKLQGSWLFFGLLPIAFILTVLPAAGLFLVVERPLSLKPWRRARAAVVGPAVA
jgi:exopolysaccharide production protein ExoZ